MTIRILLFFLIYLLPFPRHALSQAYSILHYTSADGLPSNTVYSIYRDTKGFLWMATDMGVVRYNGSKFETFTTFNGLPDNEIFFFEEDLQHRLWLGCYNGTLCYFQNDTFFTPANKSFLRQSARISPLRHVEVENDSSITISYSDANKFLNIRGEKIRYFDIGKISEQMGDCSCIFKKKISNNRYKLIYPDFIVVIDTNNAIQSVTSNKRKLKNFTSCQSQTYLYDESYFSTTDNQILEALPELVTKNNTIIEIYTCEKKTFYATSNGLIVNDTVCFFEGQKISSISKDAYENYWVSTLGNGIYCLDNTLFDIKQHKNVYNRKVTYTYSTEKQVFFATDKNELFRIVHDSVTKIISKEFLARSGISNIYESAFYIDPNYHYYNICNGLVISIDDVRKKSPHIRIQKNDSIGFGFKAVFLSNNTLYAKMYMSICMLSEDAGMIVKDVAHHDGKIFGMAQDDKQSLWYSTFSSVYKIENDTDILQPQFKKLSFKYFEFLHGYLIGVTHTNNLVICNDISGNIVIDTVPAQNCVWDRIYKLDSNHVIVKTSNFYTILTLFHSKSRPKYSMHILENPFIPLQAESITACGNTVYFFNNGTITSINLDKLFYIPEPPRLFFTKIQTSKKTYPVNNVVIIPFNESKTLKIYFSSLSTSKMQLSWQYAISKNYQYAWTDFNAGELNLANPGYGDYVIMIRAKTFSSNYSAPISFTLQILHPFWATWWFISLVCCVFVFLLFALVIIIKRKTLETTRRKNLQMELELKAIYAQINPHFIFNTLNSALLLVRKKRFEDAYKHIYQFSRLLRSYIKSSRNKLITIIDEINNLNDYLELQQTRFGNKFEFSIFVDRNIDPTVVKIPSLLLQPFVENALNHGLLPRKEPGNIKIEFVIGVNKDEIICKIDDDGIGRDIIQSANTPGKDDSYGNLLIRDLVSIFNKYEQMNIRIEYIDKKEPLTGTTVLIFIRQIL